MSEELVQASRPAIVFLHANSFPAGTYERLFARWRDAGHDVHALEKIGHDPALPATSNWPHLRDEVLRFVDQEGIASAYLVGHSLGGFLALLAASRWPELARGVVLLDSPVVGGWRASALQFFKATGVGERLSPGHVSKRRRQHWPSADAAHAHFAAKPAFAAFAPGVLADYIASAIEPVPAHDGSGGVRLAFDRGIETAIYNTLPHDMVRTLRQHPLRCPAAFIGGSTSGEVRRVGLEATRRVTQGRMTTIEGSHLFPFERPDETAAAVLHWLHAFATEQQQPPEA